jgi:hypothetical protein
MACSEHAFKRESWGVTRGCSTEQYSVTYEKEVLTPKSLFKIKCEKK